jgi:uncharacterized membrane protein
MSKLAISIFIIMILFMTTVVMTGVVYNQLPARVPMHWNIKGEIDRYGPRATVWMLPAIDLAMVGLFIGLAWSITKVEKERLSVLWMGVCVMAFFVVIQALILSASLGHKVDMTRWMGAAMSLMFGGLGRSMRDIPRNGLAGIRTPWTMASVEAWRISHQRASKIMVVGGIAGFLVSIILSGLAGILISVGSMLYTLIDSYVATRPARLNKAG